MTSSLKSSPTQKRICNILLELLQNNSLREISVKQIIGEAKINRSSFYYYFNNIDEVFINICESFVREFFDEASLSIYGLCEESSYEDICFTIWESIIAYAYNHQKVIYILLRPEHTVKLIDCLIKYQKENLNQINSLFYQTLSRPMSKLARGMQYDFYVYNVSYNIVCVLNYLTIRNFSDDSSEIIKIFMNTYTN